MGPSVEVAQADQCRRPSSIETFGTVVGRAIGRTPLRSWLKAAFHRMLLLQSGGSGLKCSLPGGETVRVAPAYRYMSWNLDEYEAFKAELHPGSVALDVGANVGSYTLLFGQWVRPNGRVFAFEPAPTTSEGLRKHVSMNGLDSIVTVLEAAASDSCSEVEFLLETEGMSRMAFLGEIAKSASVRVPTVTIDEFCARSNVQPNLVKIDVEGFELSVLRGARETIRTGGDQIALFVEMHPTTWREIGVTKEDIIHELDEQGLKAVSLRPHDDMWTVEGECLRILRK